MLAQFFKTSGLDQLEMHSIILVVIGVSAFCAGFGWLASWVGRANGSGVAGNAVVLLMSMTSGLVAFNHFIAPLQKSHAPLLAAVAVGTAVTGLLAVHFLRSRQFNA